MFRVQIENGGSLEGLDGLGVVCFLFLKCVVCRRQDVGPVHHVVVCLGPGSGSC